MSHCNLCQLIKDKKILNVLELYSGIGGMGIGLKDSGLKDIGFELNVIAIDINTNANKVYGLNNSENAKFLSKNLASITPDELDQLEIDILTASPPCQPYTRQSAKRLEDQDNRAESFHHLLNNVLPYLVNKPKFMLIENVRNFESSKTADELLKMLKKLNYNYSQFLLSPNQFGIPNSRLRYYCLAKLADEFCFDSDDPNNLQVEYPNTFSNRSCSNCIDALFPKDLLIRNNDNYELNREKFELKKVGDFLEQEINLEQFKLEDNLIKKYLQAIDIINSESKSSCCFTSSYANYLTGTGSFLLLNNLSLDELKYLKKNPEELENKEISVRKFTPKEIANLLQFPIDFKMPDEFSLKQSYKLLGNSVNCKVVSFLFKILFLNKLNQ